MGLSYRGLTRMAELADKDDVRRRSLFVGLAILLMAASFVVIKTGRDALYFLEGGLYDLPKAYIGIALFSVPFAFVTLALMKRLGPRGARVVTPLVVAGGFAASSLGLRPGGGLFMTAFFVFVPLAYGVMFSLSWLLAADLLDGLDSKRLARAYGTIGAGSIVGGALGALIAKLLAMRVAPGVLVLVGAGMLAASGIVMLLAQARYPPHTIAKVSPVAGEKTPTGLGAVIRHRYALLLLAVASLASLTGIFVEFQFYLAAATSSNTGQQNASFFANFYLVLNLGALLVQLYIMPRLQRVLGVHGSLLIMPIAILGGAAVLITSGAPLWRSGLKVTEGGLKASIHRANWEQAYLPVEKGQRAVAKLIIDGAAARVAEGAAAGVLYVWLVVAVGDGPLRGVSYAWISYAIIVTAGLWVLTTRVLARESSEVGELDTDAFRLDVPLPDT